MTELLQAELEPQLLDMTPEMAFEKSAGLPGPLSTQNLAVELASFGRLIRARSARGNVAFTAFGEFQNLLAEQEYGLDEDYGYIMGGFRSYRHARNLMNGHALYEARQYARIANSKTEYKPSLETIGDHPCHDLELAYHWIKQADLPLFSERLYRAISTTRQLFFDALREEHIDAAYAKIQIVKELKDSDTNDALGFELITQVLDHHLNRLGIYGLDKKLELLLKTNMDELKTLHGHFSRQKFRALLSEVIAPEIERPQGAVVSTALIHAYCAALTFRKPPAHKPDSVFYCEKIVAAAKVLVNSANIENEPQTYAGFKFDKQSFNKEFDRCVDILVRRQLDIVVKKQDATEAEFQAAMDFFEDLRPLYQNVAPPDDVEPALANDDFCFAQILKDYGIPSYTKLLDDIEISCSASVIDSTLKNAGSFSVTVYENLDRAEGMLESARYPSDDPSLLAEANINYQGFSETLRETAYHSANYDWSQTYHCDLALSEKLKIVSRLFRSVSRIEGYLEEANLNFSPKRLEQREMALISRHVQEIFLESRICIEDSTGAHELMRMGYEELQEIKIELKNPGIYRKMGMTAKIVHEIERHYDQLDLLMRARRVHDESLTLRERFDELHHVRKLLNTFDNEPKLKENLQERIKLNEADIPAKIREFGLKLFYDMMTEFENYDDDVIKAFDAIETAKTALETVHKTALTDDAVFERITGFARKRRTEFLNTHARYERLSESWHGTLRKPFGKAASVNVLNEALKKTGIPAYFQIMNYARNLRDRGQTLMHPKLLESVKMTPRRLQTFIDEQALLAAAKQTNTAVEKKGVTLTMETLSQHPYQNYRAALSWVSRTSYSPLSDKPWRAAGFTGRAEFTARFRESLVDLIDQIETNLLSHGLKYGPFRFIAILRELQDAYQTLGRSPEEQKISHEDARRTIRSIGYGACRDVLASDRPASAKFKMVSRVLTYAISMDAQVWTRADNAADKVVQIGRKKEDIDNLNDAFRSLLQTRVTGALARFHARYNPDRVIRDPKTGKIADPLISQPYVGVLLAAAIGDLRTPYGLDKQEWFQKAFQPLGFESYKEFAFHMAYLRIQQVVNRTNDVIDKLEGSKREYRQHLVVLRDVDSLDFLIGKNLITARERIQIFDDLNVHEHWIRDNRHFSAPYILEAAILNARVPTATADERVAAFEECQALSQMAGTQIAHKAMKSIKDLMAKRGIDWQDQKQAHAKAARHSAARYLVTEFMRGFPKTVTPAIVNAAITMGRGGNYFGNQRHLHAMGLTQDEADALSGMTLLINLYRPLHEFLNLRPDTDRMTRHNTLMLYLSELKESMVDITEPDNLKMLGFKSMDDFIERVDGPTMLALSAIHDGAKEAIQASDAAQVVVQLNGMIEIMNISGIETRHDAQTFEKAGAMSRAQIMDSYRAVTPPSAQPKAPAL